jgi:hypothetical protein
MFFILTSALSTSRSECDSALDDLQGVVQHVSQGAGAFAPAGACRLKSDVMRSDERGDGGFSNPAKT